MAITVEDGSRVAGANSYVTVADARTYMEDRGDTVSAVDADVEILILKGMDYLESFSNRFKGELVDRDQPLSWPRTGVYIENWSWSSDEIPRQVINALLALVREVNAGEDPFNPSGATLPTVREKVDVIEVQYANPGRVSKVTKTQPSRTLINLLLKNSGLVAIRT